MSTVGTSADPTSTEFEYLDDVPASHMNKGKDQRVDTPLSQASTDPSSPMPVLTLGDPWAAMSSEDDFSSCFANATRKQEATELECKPMRMDKNGVTCEATIRPPPKLPELEDKLLQAKTLTMAMYGCEKDSEDTGDDDEENPVPVKNVSSVKTLPSRTWLGRQFAQAALPPPRTWLQSKFAQAMDLESVTCEQRADENGDVRHWPETEAHEPEMHRLNGGVLVGPGLSMLQKEDAKFECNPVDWESDSEYIGDDDRDDEENQAGLNDVSPVSSHLPTTWLEARFSEVVLRPAMTWLERQHAYVKAPCKMMSDLGGDHWPLVTEEAASDHIEV